MCDATMTVLKETSVCNDPKTPSSIKGVYCDGHHHVSSHVITCKLDNHLMFDRDGVDYKEHEAKDQYGYPIRWLDHHEGAKPHVSNVSRAEIVAMQEWWNRNAPVGPVTFYNFKSMAEAAESARNKEE